MPRRRTASTPDPAPHGREEDGTPKAPYGLNTDGTPRKSNRGRRPTPGSPRPVAGVKTNLKDTERKHMLLELADALIAAPLAGASRSPFLTRRMGRHADALAGDAFILSQMIAPGVADGLILLSKTKPQALAWMDRAEENAPVILMAQALLQGARAILENHVRPNPALADAGRNLAAIRMAQMADAVNAEAERIARRAAAQAAAEQAEEQFAAADLTNDFGQMVA